MSSYLSLSSLLKVNIKSIQYKTILMKYRLNDEMKNNKLVSYPQEEVFNKMKKDMNSRLIIAQNTKEINRLINMINGKVIIIISYEKRSRCIE